MFGFLEEIKTLNSIPKILEDNPNPLSYVVTIGTGLITYVKNAHFLMG